jgi:hypothetical protein
MAEDIHVAAIAQALSWVSTFGIKLAVSEDRRPSIVSENLARIKVNRSQSLPPANVHLLEVDFEKQSQFRDYLCNRMEGFLKELRLIVREKLNGKFKLISSARAAGDKRMSDGDDGKPEASQVSIQNKAIIFITGQSKPLSESRRLKEARSNWPEGVHYRQW